MTPDHAPPHQAHVSYLEIYNDSGFDLLDPSLENNVKALEDLPKVKLMVGVLTSESSSSLLTSNLSKRDQLLTTHRSPSTDNRDSFHRHPETVLG